MLSVRFRRERFTAGAQRGGKGDKSVIYRELVLEDGKLLSPFLYAMVKKRSGYCFCTVFIGAQKHRCEWLSRFGAVVVVWMCPKPVRMTESLDGLWILFSYLIPSQSCHYGYLQCLSPPARFWFHSFLLEIEGKQFLSPCSPVHVRVTTASSNYCHLCFSFTSVKEITTKPYYAVIPQTWSGTCDGSRVGGVFCPNCGPNTPWMLDLRVERILHTILTFVRWSCVLYTTSSFEFPRRSSFCAAACSMENLDHAVLRGGGGVIRNPERRPTGRACWFTPFLIDWGALNILCLGSYTRPQYTVYCTRTSRRPTTCRN